MTALSSSPPSNDLFAARIQLFGLPAVTNGSNVDAAKQSGEPNYFVDVGGSFATYQPVWYSWTAQTSGPVSIVVTMPQHRPLVGAFTGDSLSNLAQISTMSFNPGYARGGVNYFPTEARFIAVDGVNYAIGVDGRFPVTLEWDPNDNPDVAGYKIYYGAASQTYTNVIDAGNSTNQTIYGLLNGVAYYFAVTAYGPNGLESDFSDDTAYSVPVSTSTAGQTFDLAVIAPPSISIISPISGTNFVLPSDINLQADGSDGGGGSLQRVDYYYRDPSASSDLFIGTATASPFDLVWSNVTTGHYVLTAKGFDQFGGTVSSSIPFSVGEPQNNNFDNRFELVGSDPTATGSTAGASREPGEPPLISGIPTHHTVWWTWTAPADGLNALVVSTQADIPVLGVFTGSALTALTQVSGGIFTDSSYSNGVFSYVSQTRFTARAGTTYSIVIDAEDQPFTLAITAPPSVRITSPISGTNVVPGSSLPIAVLVNDIDEGISRVEYFATNANSGAVLFIGVASSPPFSILWNGIPPGRHDLAAKAFDSRGARTISASISVMANGQPLNDNFTNAIPLNIFTPVSAGSNIGAGKEPGEPEVLGEFPTSATVWWSWVAPSDGSYSFVVGMPSVIPIVGVLRGSSKFFPDLVAIETTNTFYSTQSNSVSYETIAARFEAFAGQKYSFGVDGRYHSTGPMTVSISTPPEVQISSPLAGADFPPGSDIVLEVSGDDQVARVEYSYDSDSAGHQFLGAVTNAASFTLLWTNVPSGRYTVTAEAFNSLGAITISPGVLVTVGRPPNDDFAGRIEITNSPATVTGSQIAAVSEPGEPSLLPGSENRFTIWWTWTAPSNGSYSALVTMPFSMPVVGVFAGDSLSTLLNVGTFQFDDPLTVNDTNFFRSEARFDAISGNSYVIAVDTVAGPGGFFDLAIVTAPSVTIVTPASESILTPGTEVLFEVNASGSSEGISRVLYYVDDSFVGTRLLGTSSNSPSFSLSSSNWLRGRYLITARAIDGTGATASSTPIELIFGPPPNDHFTNRISLTGIPVVTNGSTLAAGQDSGEPSTISDYAVSRTVWWTWTAPADGFDTVVVTSPNYHPIAGVFTGTSVSNLNPVSVLSLAEFSASNGVYFFTSEARFQAVAGNDYLIAVDSVGQDFTLALTAVPTVQITSPASGDFVPGSDITLQSITTALGGPITEVVYFAGNLPDNPIPIGEGTDSLHSLSWTNVAAGAYLLTARAVDHFGATAYSAPVPMTVGRPPNDAFSQRTMLSGSPVSVTGTNLAASLESGEPSQLGGYSTAHTVWWEWTASIGGPNVVRVTMRNHRPITGVFTGDSVSNLTLVSSLTVGDFILINGEYYSTCEALFEAFPGATYVIVVDDASGVGTSFDLAITAPPAVQIIAPIDGADFGPGSNVTLQVNASDPDGTVQQVAYSAENNPLGTADIPPFGLSVDNLATGIYTVRATAVDDSGASVVSDPITFTVGRPGNDNFDARYSLIGSVIQTDAVTTAASREPGEPDKGGWPAYRSVWWSWTPPVSGNYTISTEGSDFETLVAVYLGSSISNLSPVAADLSGSFNSRLSFDAFPTNTYQISVDGWYESSGHVELSILPTPISIQLQIIDAEHFVMQFTGGEGQLAIIEASEDLVEWVPISTNTIVAGTIMFADINAAQFAHRFYRAKLGLVATPVSVKFQSLGNGEVTLRSSGGEGSLVVIEASDNLVGWTPISTNRIISGMVTFSDVGSTLRAGRFYRLTGGL